METRAKRYTSFGKMAGDVCEEDTKGTEWKPRVVRRPRPGAGVCVDPAFSADRTAGMPVVCNLSNKPCYLRTWAASFLDLPLVSPLPTFLLRERPAILAFGFAWVTL